MIYLASPYSHPDSAVRQSRFDAVCKCAASMMRRGLLVLCPIAHSHPLVTYGLPTGFEFWQRLDEAFIRACSSMSVLMLDGWEESVGVRAEMLLAQSLYYRIDFITPEGE